jgi:hypothetical protein
VSGPGTHTSWTPGAKSLQRRAAELRNLGGPDLREAHRLEASARLTQLVETKLQFQWRSEPSPQDLALLCFFDQTLKLAFSPPKAVTIAQANKARKPYIAMANRLRADAVKHSEGYPDQRLLNAAYRYEELANNIAPTNNSPLLVQRKHRGDPALRGFVIALADMTNEIFNARLYGTVSTIANVVFDRSDISAENVRKMLRIASPR